MRLSLYLAYKYIVNNKKKSFFLLLTISISLMMIIAIGVVMENTYNESNFSRGNFPLLLHTILLITLFITVFLSMNLIISDNVRILGIFSALGISPPKIRNIILFHSLLLSILSIPIGTFLGIISSYSFLQLTIGRLNASVEFSLSHILVSIILCIISVVMASIYPAVEASKVGPIEAMNFTQDFNQEGKYPNRLTMKRAGSRFSFAVLFGMKNVLKNKERTMSFILILSALLAVFIKLSAVIETSWKSGGWRKSYSSDYEIGMSIGGEGQKAIDLKFIEKIKKMDGIKNIYYQYSIFDMDTIKVGNSYSYYFKLNSKILTEQGSRQLELSSPITRNGFYDYVFVMAGISAYTEKELSELASNYLIEGEIDIEKMKNEAIILLPKYIQWLENIDIPYSHLKIGDTISLVEDRSDSLLDIDIRKTYEFKIGGFLDSLPLKQVNGVSNGFVAIMHHEQLESLETENKGIKAVYIDIEESANIEKELKIMAKNEDLNFINNLESFEGNEKRKQETMMKYAFYSIFIVVSGVIFLAIFNLVLSNIVMRKKEFSILYAIGVLNWQRAISIIVETLAFTLPGLILGVSAGILMIVTGDLRSEILSISQLIPWLHISLATTVVVLAVLLPSIIGISYINKNITNTPKLANLN